jgi:hypothetical protein
VVWGANFQKSKKKETWLDGRIPKSAIHLGKLLPIDVRPPFLGVGN